MRASLQLTITGLIALTTGAMVFAFAAGASATDLRDGSYSGDLASSVPSNLAPAGGKLLEYPIDPIALTWDAVPGATKYEVEIAPDANGVCDTGSEFDATVVVASSDELTDTAYVPDMGSDTSGKMIESGDYCWHVRADDETPGEWSTVGYFSVTRTVVPTNLRFYNDTDGDIPRTSSDSDYASGSTSSRNSGYLRWEAVPGATGYDIQIASSASFSNSSIVLRSTNSQSTSKVLPQIPDNDYYWRVRAVGGPWTVADAPFSIRRFDSTWIDSAAKYPAGYGTSVNDYRVGWDPVAGASYYEVQAATTPNCFWDNSRNDDASPAYGDSGTFSSVNCRLTAKETEKSTTLNNWATSRMLLSSEVREAIETDCSDDEGACVNDAPLAANGDSVYWRVRPIWRTTPEHETLWTYSEETTTFGAWLQDETAPRPNMFQVDRASGGDYNPVAAGASANRCNTGAANHIAGGGCLRMMAGGISASQTGVTDSTTLQVPLLEWSPVQGTGTTSTGPGSYWIQIAHDPFFNQMVWQEAAVPSAISIPELSFSPPKGLPDDEDGYWWRAIPCLSADADAYCERYYYEGAPGLSTLAGGPYADGAQPQMFKKKVEMSTKVSDLGEPAPLLSVAGAGASTPEEWARGVQGAEYYQFQLSRSPVFPSVEASDATPANVVNSTQPRVQPRLKSSDKMDTLAGGRWYWRARGVDHNDVAGGWSATSQFNVTMPAPTITGGNGAIGAGVIATWAPVAGAAYYRVDYSTTSNFSSNVTKLTTAQLGFRIPAAQVGQVYWRVRAEAGATDFDGTSIQTGKTLTGAWSAVNSTTIVPQTRLRHGVSAELVNAGAKVTFEGQLSVSGVNLNGQVVQLQRKNAGCATAGSYNSIAKGKTSGDGRASISAVVLQNACYRFAYAGGTALYSPPFAVKVRPVVKAKVPKRKVNRGAKSCAKLTSNRPLTGTIAFQYLKPGKDKEGNPNTWKDFTSGKVRNFKSKTLCFKIPIGGAVKVRTMITAANYEKTSVMLGSFRVNNVWIKKN